MYKLGEQWVEELNGKMHMYKAVEGPCERCDISHTCNLSVDCHMERGLIAKDLGILNEDGCLPEERTGEYPTIKKVLSLDLLMWVWWVGIDKKADINGAKLSIGVEALTEQEAIDAWNRRS